MNHLCARQRKNDGRWGYTYNGVAWGYCGVYYEPDTSTFPWNHASQEQIDRHVSNKDKYHEDGHATEEEACECFKQYQLDYHLRFSKQSDQQHKCKICGEYTEGLAYVGAYNCYSLCENHQNRESVEQIYQVGESWQS